MSYNFFFFFEKMEKTLSEVVRRLCEQHLFEQPKCAKGKFASTFAQQNGVCS
jgi:hypothetical protein